LTGCAAFRFPPVVGVRNEDEIQPLWVYAPKGGKALVYIRTSILITRTPCRNGGSASCPSASADRRCRTCRGSRRRSDRATCDRPISRSVAADLGVFGRLDDHHDAHRALSGRLELGGALVAALKAIQNEKLTTDDFVLGGPALALRKFRAVQAIASDAIKRFEQSQVMTANADVCEE